MMTECFTLRREITLQQRALHKLAKMCWGDNVLRSTLIRSTIEDIFPTELNIHLNEVLNKLPQTLNALPKAFSADLPKLLKDKVMRAVINLQQGYKEALIWENKYGPALPFTVLNPVAAGVYQAGCFIDPTGHFNDRGWAKQFVSDEEQDVYCRFQFACFYCFEEEIKNIWHVMKTNGKLPCRGQLSRIKLKYGDLVGIWAYKLENKTNELIENYSSYADGIYVCVLEEAFDQGNEYAARYFWSRCTGTERAEFLKNPNCYDILYEAAKKNYFEIVYFIYSLISPEQKRLCIQRTVPLYGHTPSIWFCLLDSPYWEIVLNEILTFPYEVPSKFYALILKKLAYRTKESRSAIHARIFKTLWNHLLTEQRQEVFQWGLHVIFLIKINALDLLEFIIQPLSKSEKDQMLLNNWGGAGWTAMDQFSKSGDYDALLRYLLFFLIHRNPFTHKLTLTADAVHFLNSIKGTYASWIKYDVSESEQEEVCEIIESLEGSLSILYQLLESLE